MDQLRYKSELSLDAAEFLYKNNYYNAACHPMYYSCLQLISYKLIKKGISLEEQGSQISNYYKGNTHQYLIDKSMQLIPFNKKTDCNKNHYLNDFKMLSRLRVQADYKINLISQSECERGMRLAKSLILEINKIRL